MFPRIRVRLTGSRSKAKREADACLKTISGKRFDYPIYFDIEDKTQLGLSDRRLQDVAASFCTAMESAGYWFGIYSYKAFLKSVFTADFMKRYAVWVAHTGVTKTDFKYEHGIWQYSHTGTVKGIASAVDLNYGYEDYPAMMKTSGALPRNILAAVQICRNQDAEQSEIRYDFYRAGSEDS